MHVYTVEHSYAQLPTTLFSPDVSASILQKNSCHTHQSQLPPDEKLIVQPFLLFVIESSNNHF